MRRISARSRGVVFSHDARARCAAAKASTASSREAEATLVITCPVAGLITSKVSPSEPSRQVPSISRRFSTCSNNFAISPVSMLGIFYLFPIATSLLVPSGLPPWRVWSRRRRTAKILQVSARDLLINQQGRYRRDEDFTLRSAQHHGHSTSTLLSIVWVAAFYGSTR